MVCQGLMSLGVFECMKNSWRMLVSLRGFHTTAHITLEISAFLSYMVMHTVHLRLEYGPEEKNLSSLFTADNAQLILMSSSFFRDSTPLFGSRSLKGNLQRWGASIHSVTLACVSEVGLRISKSTRDAFRFPTNILKCLMEDRCKMRGHS